MWRLWLLLLAVAVCGQEKFVDGDDGEDLERRLDDGIGLGEMGVRWRMRGAQGDWRGLQVYQKLEWKPSSGHELFILAERDPGETNWRDFSCFYYALQGKLGKVVVGDLRPGFAAGLLFGRGRRGGVVVGISAGDSERIGYRSSGENDALRGVVWRIDRGRYQGVLLVGSAIRDGRTNASGQVTSLPAGGYHVTETETAGRDLLSIAASGLRLRWRGEQWQWGVTGLTLGFSHSLDLRRGGRTPWGFVGAQQRMASVDVKGSLGSGRLSLEVARDTAGHWGGVGAVALRVLRKRLRWLVRYYAPGLHSFFGGAPGASGMQNELGLTADLAGRGWRLYAERYRRPQRSYFIPVAATYTRWGAEWQRRLADRVSVRGQWQERWWPRWRDGRLHIENYRKGRLDLDRNAWRWRVEAQRLVGSGQVEWGWLGSARLKVGWLSLHLSGFRTDSYSTRVYEYEVDLPGAVSIRPLFGSGWRGYLLASANWRGWTVSGRYRLQQRRQIRQYGGVQVDWHGGDIDKR